MSESGSSESLRSITSSFGERCSLEMLDRIRDGALADRGVGQHQLADHLVDHGVGLFVARRRRGTAHAVRCSPARPSQSRSPLVSRPLLPRARPPCPCGSGRCPRPAGCRRPARAARPRTRSLGSAIIRPRLACGGAAEVAERQVGEVGAALAAPVRAGRQGDQVTLQNHLDPAVQLPGGRSGRRHRRQRLAEGGRGDARGRRSLPPRGTPAPARRGARRARDCRARSRARRRGPPGGCCRAALGCTVCRKVSSRSRSSAVSALLSVAK